MEQANGENTENLVEQFSTILTTLTAFRTQITTLQNQVKVLEKNVKKQMKTYEKAVSRNIKIKEIEKHLDLPLVDQYQKNCVILWENLQIVKLARTEVTQYLIQYIKDNNLQWAENRKIIKPDSKIEKTIETSKK